MPIDHSMQFCQSCNRVQPSEKRSVNHILHFLIGMFTCGLWWIVWAIVCMTAEPYRCSRCGGKC